MIVIQSEIVDARNIKIYESLGIGSENTKKLCDYLATIDFTDISNILIKTQFPNNHYTFDLKYTVFIKKSIIRDIYILLYKHDTSIYLGKVDHYIIDVIKYKLLEHHEIEHIDDMIFDY